MARPVSHQLDIYGTWLHFAGDHQAWNTLRRRFAPKFTLDAASTLGLGVTIHEIHDTTNENHLFLYVDTTRLHGKARLEIVAHEATHAATMLLDHIGQKYDGESEALAYLVGFIAAYCWGVCEEAT